MRKVLCAGAILLCAGTCQAQPVQVGAVLEYQVALPGGQWRNVVYTPVGTRVEWRAVLRFTGTQAAVALGRLYYQTIIFPVQNQPALQRDQLGAWRNSGISGQTNTTLALGLLTQAEGNSTFAIADYGRVHFGFTPRSTAVGGSGPLTAHRHAPGERGAPTIQPCGMDSDWDSLGFMRIAGANLVDWYPGVCNTNCPPSNGVLWGNVADNNTTTSTWFRTGTQDITIFRQAFIVGSANDRRVTITSEPASIAAVYAPLNERSMTWALAGQGGSTASVQVGVEIIPAEIVVMNFGPLPCSTIDVNHDGSLFDPMDIEAFLSVYSGGPCVPDTACCISADFDQSGQVNDCDVLKFLNKYSEGACSCTP